MGEARPHAPTIADILADPLTALAARTWGGAAPGAFDAPLVARVYRDELAGGAAAARVTILELSSYLERYLWPHFEAGSASHAHVMSIVALVNEKARSRVPVWDFMGPAGEPATADKFGGLFARVLRARGDAAFGAPARLAVVQFLITVYARARARMAICIPRMGRIGRVRIAVRRYASLEHGGVRASAMRVASLPMWRAVAPARVERALARHPQLRGKYGKLAAGARAGGGGGAGGIAALDRALEEGYLASLIDEFLGVVHALPVAPAEEEMRYVCRFTELLVDLLSALPTRRFTRLLVEDRHVVARCRISRAAAPPADGAPSAERGVGVFRQLVDSLSFIYAFAVDDITGVPLSEPQVCALGWGSRARDASAPPPPPAAAADTPDTVPRPLPPPPPTLLTPCRARAGPRGARGPRLRHAARRLPALPGPPPRRCDVQRRRALQAVRAPAAAGRGGGRRARGARVGAGPHGAVRGRGGRGGGGGGRRAAAAAGAGYGAAAGRAHGRRRAALGLSLAAVVPDGARARARACVRVRRITGPPWRV